ncbi:hypothetical protein FQN57_000315 [Myotisia sp. PD_48]|nr:hypothetical protein FQN57_000315 [Myotisia sp. PD_48]
MTIFDTAKTLLVIFGPFLIRRTIATYRSFREYLAYRPPPQPVAQLAACALNILFCSTAFFLFLSLPSQSILRQSGERNVIDDNIFQRTSSLFNTPNELLFTRLGSATSYQNLSPRDNLLKTKFLSPAARAIYLRFGAESLISCPFCSVNKPTTYLLYYLPFNTLLPHLFHLFVIGLATSKSLVGVKVGKWRKRFLIGAIALLVMELSAIIYGLISSLNGGNGSNRSSWTYVYNSYSGPPPSFHARLSMIRPLAFTVFDAACAALVYLSSTNRFFYSLPTPTEQIEQIIKASMVSITSAMTTVETVNAFHTVLSEDVRLRNEYLQHLTGVDEDKWVWQEEEVVRAIATTIKRRGEEGGNLEELDIAKVTGEINAFVQKVTVGL